LFGVQTIGTIVSSPCGACKSPANEDLPLR
jgi:hypothetical protein